MDIRQSNNKSQDFISEWSTDPQQTTNNVTSKAINTDLPVLLNVSELRKAAKYVFLATEEDVAHDLSDKLNRAANKIEALQDFAIWMTGCGYDFCQHEYFIKQRDQLLKT